MQEFDVGTGDVILGKVESGISISNIGSTSSDGTLLNAGSTESSALTAQAITSNISGNATTSVSDCQLQTYIK